MNSNGLLTRAVRTGMPAMHCWILDANLTCNMVAVAEDFIRVFDSSDQRPIEASQYILEGLTVSLASGNEFAVVPGIHCPVERYSPSDCKVGLLSEPWQAPRARPVPLPRSQARWGHLSAVAL